MSRKQKIVCDKCGKTEDPVHWATLHYKDTFGNNDGSGAFTDETDETYDLCVKCKQSFYKWLEENPDNRKCLNNKFNTMIEM